MYIVPCLFPSPFGTGQENPALFSPFSPFQKMATAPPTIATPIAPKPRAPRLFAAPLAAAVVVAAVVVAAAVVETAAAPAVLVGQLAMEGRFVALLQIPRANANAPAKPPTKRISFLKVLILFRRRGWGGD